jgi:hypothetical protein
MSILSTKRPKLRKAGKKYLAVSKKSFIFFSFHRQRSAGGAWTESSQNTSIQSQENDPARCATARLRRPVPAQETVHARRSK